MEDMLDRNIGKYRVISRIGTGSMFLATDTNNAKVAVKQHQLNLDCPLNKDEMNILRKIKHKNILSPLDIIEDQAYTYVIYEYCVEQNLADYMNQVGKLAEEQVRDIMRQIVNAYQELRKNNVLHKNIKPQNILIVKEKLAIKLCDFAIVRKNMLENESYIAPEVCYKTAFNYMADVWSIGAVMYFMINGELPRETLEQKKSNNYLMKHDISSHCLSFMLKCLQYETSLRLTCEEMTVHPFILNEVTNAKAILSTNLIEEEKAHTSIKDDQKVIKFMKDEAYVCYCEIEQGVILSCGHSICLGCIKRIRT